MCIGTEEEGLEMLFSRMARHRFVSVRLSECVCVSDVVLPVSEVSMADLRAVYRQYASSESDAYSRVCKRVQVYRLYASSESDAYSSACKREQVCMPPCVCHRVCNSVCNCVINGKAPDGQGNAPGIVCARECKCVCHRVCNRVCNRVINGKAPDGQGFAPGMKRKVKRKDVMSVKKKGVMPCVEKMK